MATFDISFVSDSRFFNEFVSSDDPSDFYRFRFFTVNEFNLTLNGLSQDANVVLYLDSNNNGIADTGEQITGSANLGTSEESISRSLGAGTYIVQITNVLGSNTPYNLSLSGIPTLIGDVGGNSASSAFDLGILGSSRIFNDFVGSADQLDYYRFRLDRVTDFSLLLNGLSQNANVRIYADENNNSQTDNNELIAALTNSGLSEKSLNQPLNAGTYFVVVDNASNFTGVGSDTRYNLSLSNSLPSSAIITDSNLLDSLKGLIASAAKGFARGQVLDLSPDADTIELSSDIFAQFPGGVRAFEGNDTIQGSDANEFLYGNSGADVLQGLGSDDIVLGGMDDDQIFGEDGNDYLNGNKGNDIVNGGFGSDLLRGGQDNDVLTGGDGDDVLIGDFGGDTLIGGAGSDTFVLRRDAEAGKFDPNLADRILEFSAIDRIAIAGNVSIPDISVNAAGTDVAIQLTATGEILGIVQNATPEIIQIAIFIASSTDSALSF